MDGCKTSADRGRIAELRSDFLHHRRRPSTEVLGRDVATGDLAQIAVDLLRRDVSEPARLVDIFEQLRAGQVVTVLEEARALRVGHHLVMQYAVLATEIEHDAPAFDAHVIVVQGS